MTDALSSAPMEIEKRAALWLADHDRDDWTDDDQAALDKWLAESPAHEIAYWRLETAWVRTVRLAALRRPDATPVERRSDKPRQTIFTRIAVAFLVVAIAGLLANAYFFAPKEQIFSTNVGGHKKMVLADGSLVELNTDTTLRILSDGNTRKVFLDKGEAYFHVTHDADHPFVVIAGDNRVTDIGTAFVMRRDAQRLEVTLLEGRARFESTGSFAAKPVELAPGDEIVSRSDGAARTHKPISARANDLGWRHGVLIFDGTTLADAAAEFNRYNQVKLIVADTKVARLTINGTFRTNNLQAFADATQVVLGLTAENHKDEIVISR